MLVDKLGGNDIRIALESFCKDILDVVVTKLGYKDADVWSAIADRIPAYRPSSMSKDWDEEIRRLTVGGAVMILTALGPLAFPTQIDDVNDLLALLAKLSKMLNHASHDREPTEVADAPQLICQILEKAETFLGELPWHLDASFVYGEQPKVLSGEAWSHGYPTPRLLRVIDWTGKSPGAKVTLWNKTRRNPLITDPVFLVRPGRH